MDKKIAGMMLLFITGCVAVRSLPELSISDWERPVIPLTDIEQVEVGMTSDEVTSVMGTAVDAGYEMAAENGSYEEILVENPYKEEIFEDLLARYRVLYYVTYIRKADGKITDDELTPLVFEDDRLIGMGQDFLDELKHGRE